MTAPRAVVFDWGGTLTPWHEVDLRAQWRAYAEMYDPVRSASLAEELFQTETHLYDRQRTTFGEHGTGTLESMFAQAGIDLQSAAHRQAMEAYLEFWTPHTYPDPDAAELLRGLRSADCGSACCRTRCGRPSTTSRSLPGTNCCT